jgi:PKD repeat protein
LSLISKFRRLAISFLAITSAVVVTSSVAILAYSPSTALASAQSVPAYGEVERFGGFESGAAYGPSTTTGIKGAVGEKAQFVYPVGMAVDTEDSAAPDDYSIFVLDNVNPQALNTKLTSKRTTSMSLEYRIQKINEYGVVLATTAFTLTSNASPEEANLHAVSLAVDGHDGRVYVLIADAPPVGSPVSDTSSFNAAYKIDAWTTALTPADGSGELPKDPMTGAGELVGPDASHSLQGAAFVGDIDGESIAVDGNGANADLALAGNKFTTATKSEPTIELIKTEEANAGEIGGEWKKASETEDAAAQALGVSSGKLYSMSANPDGSFNVSLGPPSWSLNADSEPNMATVSASLDSTATLLPWQDATENMISHSTSGEENPDRAATVAFQQYVETNSEAFQPYGATPRAGALAPSVVQLAGEGTSFPAGLYAGLVAQGSEEDTQNPTAESPYSWRTAFGMKNNGVNELTNVADLGIRVFSADEAAKEEASLAMIGNVIPGGACNLQSSPTGFNYSYKGGSFVALAPGRDGVLFVLVQPNLINTSEAHDISEPINPASAVGAGMGDQVVEFAPGSQSVGAGANASKWQECPQPSGSFSVANGDVKEPTVGELAVEAGAKLEFNAEEIDLRGGSPWAYDWDLEGGTNNSGPGPIFERPWTINNTFAAIGEGNGTAWEWPSPTIEAEFKTPGTYTETLKLVNDFGTLITQRKLRVIEPGAITNTKITPATNPTEGEPVLLKAFATLPKEDKVKDYHWEFGDGQGEDTGESGEAEHIYTKAGSYTVKVMITDALGQKVQVEENVTVAAVSAGGKTTPEEKPVTKVEEKHETPVAKVETPVTKTTPVTKPKPLTNAQKLAKALKACKKNKSKKLRASCEKQAKKMYAAKPKSKKSKKKK